LGEVDAAHHPVLRAGEADEHLVVAEREPVGVQEVDVELPRDRCVGAKEPDPCVEPRAGDQRDTHLDHASVAPALVAMTAATLNSAHDPADPSATVPALFGETWSKLWSADASSKELQMKTRLVLLIVLGAALGGVSAGGALGDGGPPPPHRDH